jgi:archaeal type IV pilus assembly protein PilA
MKTTTIEPKELKTSHRAVAPVIATLLMVAIAVVGGTIIFVFSQGFFSSSQISGTPTIEAVRILGYDASDSAILTAQSGTVMNTANSGGSVDGVKSQDERVAVYVKNDSVQAITLSEMRFGGTAYNYDTTTPLSAWNDAVNFIPGEYVIVNNTASGTDTVIQANSPVIEPGQTVTILIDLDADYRIGRDTQFKLTTTNGAIFVGTVNIGQQSG